MFKNRKAIEELQKDVKGYSETVIAFHKRIKQLEDMQKIFVRTIVKNKIQSTTLRVCPFCGQVPEVCAEPNYHTFYTGYTMMPGPIANEKMCLDYSIQCKNIYCAVSPKTDTHLNFDDAATQWNNDGSKKE